MSGLGWATRVASCHTWGSVGGQSTGASLKHAYSRLSCALDDALMSMSSQSPLKGWLTTHIPVQVTLLHNLAQPLFFSEHPRHLLSVVNELPHCVHCVVLLCHLGSLLPTPGSVYPEGGCIFSRLWSTRAYTNSLVPLAPLTSQSRCRCLRGGSTRCLQGIWLHRPLQ